MKNRSWFIDWKLIWLALLGTSALFVTGNDVEQVCSWEDKESCTSSSSLPSVAWQKDPHLKPMVFSLKDDPEEKTFEAYISSDIATYYNKTPGTVTAKEPSFTGMFGKFINLSPNTIRVYWQPTTGRVRTPSYISDISPFGAAGTATYPGHRFIVVDAKDPTDPSVATKLVVWTVKTDHSLYPYDPYGSIDKAAKSLSEAQLELYKLQLSSLEFNSLYQKFTGREWLPLYGRKYPPRYPMWPADSFGQTHTLTTKETHFETIPPADKLHKVSWYRTPDEERRYLQEYRTPGIDSMNITMKVLSVSPRVFEIKNFLSEEECHHILELATGMQLSRSTTRAGTIANVKEDDGTRTSKNSWLAREKSPIVDSIYRRAADLLQIDEAFMRYRQDANETGLLPESRGPISERLQLVRYLPGEQYTPHHDFSVPDLKDHQASRFATVLFYLNDVILGGETAFPLWVNAETTEQLVVKPEVGKAVLFYNQLPDGNYDERSQHAALPTVVGNKWLTNLWVWDPFIA